MPMSSKSESVKQKLLINWKQLRYEEVQRLLAIVHTGVGTDFGLGGTDFCTAKKRCLGDKTHWTY